MLRHTVLFRWKADTTEEQIQAAQEGLGSLPGRIPAIKRYEFGADLGLADGNFDFALVADFDDTESWRSYLQDPAHLEVVARDLKPVLAERVSVQYSVGE